MTNSDNLDAVIAAPESHKVLLENEDVRVLEVIIEPGQKEPVHNHLLPSVMIVDGPAKIRYHKDDGGFEDIEPSTGPAKVEWMPSEPLHAIENLDTKPYHAFRVELKQNAKS